MANPTAETVTHPFAAFNFAVEISVPGVSDRICAGSFAECDGLELTMEPRSLREGGNNGVVHRLAGPAGYGQLTLKRGVTSNLDLWHWFGAAIEQPSLRGSGEVVLLARDHSERARFLLTRLLPVKLKAPPLNAKDGILAVEELGLVYERLTLREPSGGALSVGVGVSGGVSVGASVSLGIG
jgi:phage tail-like protein